MYYQIEATPTTTSSHHTGEAEHKTWQTFLKHRTITENATLLRYLKHQGNIITAAPDVTYRDVVSRRYQRRAPQTDFMVLSAIAITKTADSQFVWQPRDSGDWPLSYELPGGFLRANTTSQSITDFIISRVKRELSLTTETISRVSELALLPFPAILEMMSVFLIETKLTSQDLKTINPKLWLVPADYDPATHSAHYAIPLHYPSATVWHKFLPYIQN